MNFTKINRGHKNGKSATCPLALIGQVVSEKKTIEEFSLYDLCKTSKFHGEFMSPALFLFEVLKMVKLTRGPLVLYQLPKY